MYVVSEVVKQRRS